MKSEQRDEERTSLKVEPLELIPKPERELSARPRERAIYLTDDEATVMDCILGHIGGSPSGARGEANIVRDKINAIFGHSIPCKHDLRVNHRQHSIYFEL